jgi:hypothetical protein
MAQWQMANGKWQMANGKWQMAPSTTGRRSTCTSTSTSQFLDCPFAQSPYVINVTVRILLVLYSHYMQHVGTLVVQ